MYPFISNSCIIDAWLDEACEHKFSVGRRVRAEEPITMHTGLKQMKWHVNVGLKLLSNCI